MMLTNPRVTGAKREGYRSQLQTVLISDGVNRGFAPADAHYDCATKDAATGSSGTAPSAKCAKTGALRRAIWPAIFV